MQGKIYKIVKILGRMNSRTVMMERFQDARVLMTLLSTEDSNDSQKRMRAVLTIHPTLAYRFFSLIRPLFLPKGVGYARVYCTKSYVYTAHAKLGPGGTQDLTGIAFTRTFKLSYDHTQIALRYLATAFDFR